MNRPVAELLAVLAFCAVLIGVAYGTHAYIEHEAKAACQTYGGKYLEAPRDGGKRWVPVCWVEELP